LQEKETKEGKTRGWRTLAKNKVAQYPRLLTMTRGYKSTYATFMNEECITAIARNQEGTLRNQRNGDYILHSPY